MAGEIKATQVLKKKEDFSDKEMNDFLAALEEWHTRSLKSFTQPQDALLTAFEELGLVDSSKLQA